MFQKQPSIESGDQLRADNSFKTDKSCIIRTLIKTGKDFLRVSTWLISRFYVTKLSLGRTVRVETWSRGFPSQ